MAEITYRPFARGHKAKAVRLIVRRVPPTPGSQLALYTEYSYHAFIRNRRHPRNTAIMWIHRRKEEAVARFGAESLVRWEGAYVLNEGEDAP